MFSWHSLDFVPLIEMEMWSTNPQQPFTAALTLHLAPSSGQNGNVSNTWTCGLMSLVQTSCKIANLLLPNSRFKYYDTHYPQLTLLW